MNLKYPIFTVNINNTFASNAFAHFTFKPCLYQGQSDVGTSETLIKHDAKEIVYPFLCYALCLILGMSYSRLGNQLSQIGFVLALNVAQSSDLVPLENR